MSDTYTLPAEERKEAAKIVKRLGNIPAIVYGKGEKNSTIQIDYQTFRKTFRDAGYSSIIDIELGSKKIPVLVHEVDLDPVKDTFIHIDFKIVKMDEEVETNVPLKFVGMSIAVKDLGGTLIREQEALSIKCLPKDLIHEIEVDISVLEDFQARIILKDLIVPSTIELLGNEDEIIASISAPRVEEEETTEEVSETAEGGEEGEGEADEEKKEE